MGGESRVRVVFVCTGNICRSPMAELMLARAFADAGMGDDVAVDSAGTTDWEAGRPIDERAAAKLTELGIDSHGHRARRFEQEWYGERDLIRYTGAAYLVYLGVRKFLAKPEHSEVRALQVSEGASSMFRRGVWVNLLNPKAIVFFLALIPQFIRPEGPLLSQYGVLAATVIVIDVLVMWFFYAGTARSFRRFTEDERGQTILNRTFGSLFVGVGALLALG